MNCSRCDGLLIPDPYDTLGKGLKCVNCGGTMPKFKTEADKQAWLEKCRATRAKRSNAPAKPVGAPPSTTGRGGIAGAIEEIDSKIAALENVKKNLIHAQELVNL